MNFSLNIDYFDCINNIIKKILYQPPFPKKTHAYISLMPKAKLFHIVNTKYNLKTTVSEVVSKTHVPFSQTSSSCVMIFSHGNACDICSMYNYSVSLSEKLGIPIIQYDYPTYSLSTGKLNEQNCCQALKDVIEHYTNKNNRIILVGQSLGTGVLIDYVSKNTWNTPIILISPFTSIPRIICNHFLMDYILHNNNYSSIYKISHITCPVVVFHGKNDTIISYQHSLALFALLQNKHSQFILFNSVNHKTILPSISMMHYKKIINAIHKHPL